MTVVLVPIIVQQDESQIMSLQRESPIKVLHDIITHNMEEKELLGIDISEEHLHKVMVK